MNLFGLHVGSSKRIDILETTARELRREIEDIGWTNFARDPQGSGRFLPQGLQRVVARSRQMWVRSPMAGHWVNLTTAFVFGKGITTPKAVDERVQKILDEFWKDPDNKLSLTSMQAQHRLSAKRHYEGNVFFTLVTQPETGQVKVRIKDTEQVQDVITSPGDLQRRLFYKCIVPVRTFNFRTDSYNISNTNRVLYYPDIALAEPLAFDIPTEKLVRDARIFHARFNCDVNDKFGIPELLRGLDWIKAHKEMAGDMATLIKMLSVWAWKKKVKGSPA